MSILNLFAAVSKNLPVMAAEVYPDDDRVAEVTPALVPLGLVSVKVAVVSDPIGIVCPVSTVSTRVPVDCVQLPDDPKIAAAAPPTVNDPLFPVTDPVSPASVTIDPATMAADG